MFLDGLQFQAEEGSFSEQHWFCKLSNNATVKTTYLMIPIISKYFTA